MACHCLITGATGFTGTFIAKSLLRAGYKVSCFVRDLQRAKQIFSSEDICFFNGILEDTNALASALKGKDALVNVASIGFGHAPGIVRACRNAGVKRAVFFSSTAIFTTLEAKTRTIRQAAENIIVTSNLDFTIIRPTMIYGTPDDRNMIRLIRYLERCPIVPVMGDGKSLQQPVYVKDLSDAVPEILTNSVTIQKAYNLSGKYPLSFNDVIDTTSRLMHRKVFKVHLPVSFSIAASKALSRVPGLPSITPEQILRLNENKAFDHSEATRDFKYDPIEFSQGMACEIEEYRTRENNLKGKKRK